MEKSKFTETRFVSILKQGDAGVPINGLCRQAGIGQKIHDQWKSKHGGLEVTDSKRVKDFEADNANLKRMYAELALDKAAKKNLIAKEL